MAENQEVSNLVSREWLLSNEFAQYHLAVASAGAFFFKGILLKKSDPAYYQGVTDMLRAIIKIPLSMARTDEEKAKAKLLTEAAFKQVEASVLRSVILDE